jgi:predicted kinase
MSRRVFAEIERLAAGVLAQGHAVIADAVYGDDWQRTGIAAVAGKLNLSFDGLWLEAPQRILEQRVDARRGDASDATSTVVRAQAARIRPPAGWRRVDTGGGREVALGTARAALGLPEIH